MSHQCVFIVTDGELVQAVIKPDHLPAFVKLGFSTTADAATLAAEKETKPKRAPRKAKEDDNEG